MAIAITVPKIEFIIIAKIILGGGGGAGGATILYSRS